MGGQKLHKNGTNIQEVQAILSAQLHNDNHMLWPGGLTITVKLIRVVYLPQSNSICTDHCQQ